MAIEFNDRRTAKPVFPSDLAAAKSSVPSKGANIRSREDYVKAHTGIDGMLAKGKATLRKTPGAYAQGANGGVKIQGSKSKQRRAAAVLAGKPPVNQRPNKKK